MVKTSGQGNPNWTREEVILALDLYLRSEGKPQSKTDPEVIELSSLLRSIPYHANASKKSNFRNPDGVAFKLQNLHQVATGSGLANVSRTDQAVWKEFGNNHKEVKKIVSFIRNTAHGAVDETEIKPDFEFSEGALITRVHLTRERKSGLRKKVVQDRTKDGPVSCDACGTKGPTSDESLNLATFEVHHLIPLHLNVNKKTSLSDVTFLCATCHRLIHKLISESGQWISLEELKAHLC